MEVQTGKDRWPYVGHATRIRQFWTPHISIPREPRDRLRRPVSHQGPPLFLEGGHAKNVMARPIDL